RNCSAVRASTRRSRRPQSMCGWTAPRPTPISRPRTNAGCVRTSPRCADATASARFAWCHTCGGASAACRPRRSSPTSADRLRSVRAKSCCWGKRSTPIASATSTSAACCAWSPQSTESRVQPALHLPVQSGSDRILAAMERGYTVEEYLSLVERVRAAIPGVALSTDIIVGFHGEEEPDFRATLELMAAVRYDSAFSFKYSLRENTRAFKLGDTVSEAEKGRRLAEIIALPE